jgi:hypothetical protein
MRAIHSLLSLCGALLATSGTLVHGSPINPNLPIPTHLPIPAPTASVSAAGGESLEKRDLVDLRILNLGASIVWGLKSTDSNGYGQLQKDVGTRLMANARVIASVGR